MEWDAGAEHKPPPAPLLKDLFANERKKAKVLNFSIAYGKTAHGLAKDWGTTLQEAEETVERWYSDRPEVPLPTCSVTVLNSAVSTSPRIKCNQMDLAVAALHWSLSGLQRAKTMGQASGSQHLHYQLSDSQAMLLSRSGSGKRSSGRRP